MRTTSRPLKVTNELVNSKAGFLLKVGECTREIEPQVVLDASYGVSVPTRADFVLWPDKGSGNHKPVAVFTDGFLYHKDKVADDTLKREAIRRSGKFRVWVLSWKDVQSVFQSQNDYATLTLIPQKMPAGAQMYQLTVANGNAGSLQPDKASPMELLIRYLEMSNAEDVFAVHSRAYALSLLEIRDTGNRAAFSEWYKLSKPIVEALSIKDDEFVLEDTVFGKWIPATSGQLLTILSGVSTSDMQRNRMKADYYVFAVLNDIADDRTDRYEAEWNGFWQFFNVMQFLQGFAAVSQTGLEQSVYSALSFAESEGFIVSKGDATLDVSWSETLSQLLDGDAKEMAARLIALGVDAPTTVGYELQDSSGAVIAEAEMAWEKEKIAYLLPGQSGIGEFTAQGWIIISAESELTQDMFKGGRDR